MDELAQNFPAISPFENSMIRLNFPTWTASLWRRTTSSTEEVRAGQNATSSCRPKRWNAFKHSVNWSAPDAANQANQLAQKMALEASNDTYREGTRPLELIWTSIIRPCGGDVCIFTQPFEGPSRRIYPNSTGIFSSIRKHNQKISNLGFIGESKFGLKPTLRIVQAIVYRGLPCYGSGLCRCRKATLCQPLLRDRSGFDRLRARP